MKYFLLACEGLAGEPAEELGGRTPLEVAKTPCLDELAQKGKTGVAAFNPPSLPGSPEVALYSLLGFDPAEFYTGLAPLEALAAGAVLNDRDVAFRCDFVTVADGKMADDRAGNISSGEALTLLKELKAKTEGKTRKLYALEGHKNILVFSDPERSEDLDEAECSPPSALLGQKIAAFLPKGKAQRDLLDFMHVSQAALENHEVNRVRIDLKENPVSQCWLWGQGRKPKMPPFKQRAGFDGGFFSSVPFVKGFAQAVGLEPYRDAGALGSKPFSLFYQGAPASSAKSKELKNKIKHIEDFDAKVVAPLFKKLAASKEPWRLALAAERAHQHGLILMCGTGIEAGTAPSFNEKNCAQSGVSFDPGHEWFAAFLKDGKGQA